MTQIDDTAGVTDTSQPSPGDRLAELCTTAMESATGEVADSLASVTARLAEPLRVVVAGGVSSGKSTLVNALIGHRVAPVDAGECTRVVTEFRYGHPERAIAVDHDGAEHPMLLEQRCLPTTLPLPSDEISRVEVRLSNALLQHMTIVDTPGVNTVTSANQSAAEAALGMATTSAMASADAVLFLTPHAREADAAILERVVELGRDAGLSSANCIAVLSKVDLLVTEGDPMDAAARLIETSRQRLDGLVSEVLPLVGLLAETIEAARFAERDATTLRQLAAVEDELDREDLLLTAEDLLAFPDVDASRDDRARALERLGMYGIRTAIDLHDQGLDGAAELSRALGERSGFATLRRLLMERFASRSAVLKAHAAIEELRDVSYRAGSDGRKLRRQLERIELDPAMTEVKLLDAARALASTPMDEAQRAELRLLVSTTDPARRLGLSNPGDVRDVAFAAIGRWASWASDPRRSPADAEAARGVRQLLEQLWHEAGEESRHG